MSSQQQLCTGCFLLAICSVSLALAVWIMRGDNFNGRNFSVDLAGGLFSIIINNTVCLTELP